MSADAPWPLQLTFRRETRMLHVSFDDGSTYELPAEYLRVESPSAEVQGHGASTKITVAGKKNVSISAMEPVGQYAVRIIFDDGHDTGLFSWSYLQELGAQKARKWFEYETRLKQQGLSREP